MTEYFLNAVRNIFRKKFRSALTILGIAIGVASVIIIGAVGEAGKLTVISELDTLGLNGLSIHIETSYKNVSGTSSLLEDDDVKTCMSVNGVEEAMPLIMQYGTSISRGITKAIVAWGVSTDASDIISLTVKYGKMFNDEDIKNHSMVCLVDEAYAKSIYKRSNITGKTITVYLGDSYQKLTVVGIVEQGSSMLYNIVGSYIPAFVYLPYTTAEDLRGKSGYDEIAVKMNSDSDLDAAGQKIEETLDKLHNVSDKYVAENMLKQKERMANLMNIVTLVLSAIGSISLIVAGLSIMTVMMVSVNERTREIGIKKAIGASKRIILMEFLFEALFISIIGCMAGIAAGLLISKIASLITNLSVSVRLDSILYSAGFAISIGVVFGVYPAVVAARMKPVDALRQE